MGSRVGAASGLYSVEQAMIDRMGNVLQFQGQALVLRAERQRLVAANIANADTPGYVARDFDFASALRQATSAAGAAGAPAGSAQSPGRFQPRLQYAQPSQASLDGNSVDMDRERAAFVDNALKYEATLRFLNSSVRTMLEAMKSHNG